VTTDELRKAEARYQRAFQRAEELRRERNALILEAVDAGWSHAQIANATGMTRSRVGQLAQS
jgi:hypothetical protein